MTFTSSQVLNTDLDVLNLELVVPLHDESFVVDLPDKLSMLFKL